MTKQKWAIILVVTSVAFGLSGQGHTRKLRGAEPKPYHDNIMKHTPQEAEVKSYKVANRHILRIIDISGSRLVTKEIGSPGGPVSVTGGDEFDLVLGPDKKRITAEEFRVTSVEPAKGGLSMGVSIEMVKAYLLEDIP